MISTDSDFFKVGCGCSGVCGAGVPGLAGNAGF